MQAVSALSAEQFTQDLGGSFRSVRDALLHILAGEWLWLKYWKAPPENATLAADFRTRRDTWFNPDLFPDVAAVQRRWAEVEKEQVEFVNQLSDQALEEMIPFRTGRASLAHLMQHLANHSTYHRGQISLMLRQVGAAAVSTDFHVFLLERSRAQ